MSTTIRDPAAAPFHPQALTRASNGPAAALALRQKHAASVAALARGLAGGKLTGGETEAAGDFLLALAAILAGADAASEHVLYGIERGVSAAQMRRQASAAASIRAN